MKRTFQPKKRQRAKEHGFRKRMSTKSGRKILASRRQKEVICIIYEDVGRKRGGILCLLPFFIIRQMRFNMKNTQSLKLNRDFRRAYKGDNFVGGYTVVYMKKNKYQFNRLGLRVGKATGKAVTRNRLKRLMRESYRLMEDDIEKGYDFIIVARNRAVGKTQSQIQGDIRFAMRKLGLIK